MTYTTNAYSSRLEYFLFSESLMFCFQKERRLLENQRLDLDVCKARLKKAKLAEAKAAVSFIFTYFITIITCLPPLMFFHLLHHPLITNRLWAVKEDSDLLRAISGSMT